MTESEFDFSSTYLPPQAYCAALIVPAYNEARTVKSVLAIAQQAEMFREIICVDDGSSDGTAIAAGEVDGVVVVSQKNSGKALALFAGFSITNCPVVTFLDADLTGLTPKHIRNLVEPVIQEKADATIGIFKAGRGVTDLAQKIAPMISGQRCLKRSLLQDFDLWDKTGFGIEHALNDHLRKKGVEQLEVEFVGASHLMKEEKRGFFKGFLQRMKMYADIVKYNFVKRRM